MKLTRQHIFDAQTQNGAWNRDQFAMLGIAWPPKHGWLKTVIGREMSETDYARFTQLGRIRNKKNRLAAADTPTLL